MRLLKLVIARLLGLITQPSVNPVPPMPTAGPVSKEPTAQRGNKRSAQVSTKPRKSATPKSSSKPKAAQSTSAGSSRKAALKSAPAERGQSGKQRKTPVRQTRQHAK
jgi:predicted lipid-binding transport protein (Tim44 family)